MKNKTLKGHYKGGEIFSAAAGVIILLAGYIALFSGIRSHLITQSVRHYREGHYLEGESKRVYLEGESNGVRYSFAKNGVIGRIYTITAKDGTKFRCHDFLGNQIIDLVILYDPKGNIQKMYESAPAFSCNQNDKFLVDLSEKVKEDESDIIKRKERIERSFSFIKARKKAILPEQTNLLNKLE